MRSIPSSRIVCGPIWMPLNVPAGRCGSGAAATLAGGADGGGGDQRLEEGAAVSVDWIGHTGIMAQPGPATSYQLPAPSHS